MLRPVGQTENRLKEAGKLGFSTAIAPAGSRTGPGSGVTLREMTDLTQVAGEIFGAG
jgi:DNA repair protein RadA/Sms